jgi:hypothetical protein
MADINAVNPVVKPATEAVVFDKFVVDQLVFSGNGITEKLAAQAWLVPARKIEVIEEGNITEGQEPTVTYKWELYPEQRRNFLISDVWELAATDADVANTIGTLATTIARLAAERGII